MSGKLKIGLIAVINETKTLRDHMAKQELTEQIQARFYSGLIGNRQVVLAEVGPGKIQTAAATQLLITHHRVDLVLSCGSAGAVSSRVEVGDIVLADRAVVHDAGLQLDRGFQHLGMRDFSKADGMHYRRYLSSNPGLLATAREAAGSVTWSNKAPKIMVGCLASGDQIIASEQKKRWLKDTFEAIAVEMETGAMAQVAEFNDVPWLAIRAISDSADSTLDIDLPGMVTYSDDGLKPASGPIQKTVANISKAAQNPARLKALYQIRQAIQRAATRAATVTATVIQQL